MSRRHRHTPINRIELKPEDIQSFQAQQQLIQQQQQILTSLQVAFVRSLEVNYHVDLSKEHWNLDLENGLLTREPR